MGDLQDGGFGGLSILNPLAILGTGLAGGAQAIGSADAARRAKHAAADQENMAKRLREEESRNRLSTVMRMMKRRGAATDTLLTRTPLGSVSNGAGAQKQLLGL